MRKDTWRKIVPIILNILALLLCVVPALVAVIDQFPLLIDSTEKRISSISLVLILVAAIPVKRFVIDKIKTPSAWMIWLVILIAFKGLGSISVEIANIALVATAFSIAGEILFQVAKAIKRSHGTDNEQEEEEHTDGQ